jgi:hypothetical protein
MDRYIALVLKTHDPRRIKAVCLILYGQAAGPQAKWGQEKYDGQGFSVTGTRGHVTVTRLDPKTGEKSDMPLPDYGTPEAKAVLGPFLEAVRENLRQCGLVDRILIGMPADQHPTLAAVAMFNELLPGIGWMTGCHQNPWAYSYSPTDRSKTVPILHIERVYQGDLEDPARKRRFGWQAKRMELAFTRPGFQPVTLGPGRREPWNFRIAAEVALAAGCRGLGRLGADYWRDMPGIKSYEGNTFYSRYPASALGQTSLSANCTDLLLPGAGGPITTSRFENLREGLQTAEAVVFIQKALLEKKVPEDVEKQCWALLDERVNAYRLLQIGMGRLGWQARDRKLYEMAARVSQIAKPATPAPGL